jgi:hypothetical protein
MAIEFEVKVPDEPFKNTFDLGKAVKLSYIGPRYLVISIDKDTKQVCTFEGLYDSEPEVNLSEYSHPDKNFYLIDAYKHPLEASFITNFYKNEKIDDYEEELPCGAVWTYPYEPDGVLGNIYKFEMPTYDKTTDKFSDLKYLEATFSREEFENIQTRRIEEIRSEIEAYKPKVEDEESEDEAKRLADKTEYLTWLESINTLYVDVDHWKIPFKAPPA